MIAADIIPKFNCIVKEHSLHASGTWNRKVIRQPRPGIMRLMIFQRQQFLRGMIRCTSTKDVFEQKSSLSTDLIDG